MEFLAENIKKNLLTLDKAASLTWFKNKKRKKSPIHKKKLEPLKKNIKCSSKETFIKKRRQAKY